MTGPVMPRSVLRRRPDARPVRRPPAIPARPAVRRRRLPSAGLVAAALLFVGLFAVGAGLGMAAGIDLRNPFRGSDKPPPRAFPVLEPSRPLRLTIPSIGVEATISQVGLAGDGSVAVPPTERSHEAGWFERGPTPGQFGPAVIVGHADTRTGPSVFHGLSTIKPGQRIEVTRRDRRVAVFEVNSVERFGKSALPVARVYGDFSRPTLRLITCGGRWIGGDTGYADNVVVFASLMATRRA